MATYEPNTAVTTDPLMADELRKIANATRTVIAPSSATEPRGAVDGSVWYATGAWATALGAPGFYGREESAWVKL